MKIDAESRVAMAVMGLAPLVGLYAFRGIIIVLILLGLLGLLALRRGQWLLPRPRLWLGLLAALLAFGAASALWEETRGLALGKMPSLLGTAAAGLLALGYFNGMAETARGRVLTALLAGLCAAALLASLDAATGMRIARFAHALGGRVIAESYALSPPKPAATTAAIWGLACAGAFWLRGARLKSALALTAAIALSVATRSNAGLMALALGGGFWLLGLVSAKAARLLLAAGIVAGFALAPLAAHIPPTSELARELRFIPNSGFHRLAIWTFTGAKIAERPWLGWGLDGSRALPGGEDNVMVTLQYPCPPGIVCTMPQQQLPLHPHNFALQVWVELGALGAAVFAGLVAAVLLAQRSLSAPA